MIHPKVWCADGKVNPACCAHFQQDINELLQTLLPVHESWRDTKSASAPRRPRRIPATRSIASATIFTKVATFPGRRVSAMMTSRSCNNPSHAMWSSRLAKITLCGGGSFSDPLRFGSYITPIISATSAKQDKGIVNTSTSGIRLSMGRSLLQVESTATQ